VIVFPTNYTRVWVRGRFIDMAKAAAGNVHIGLDRGDVVFTPSPTVLLDAATGEIISSARSFRATPAVRDGYFQLQLPATDDPDINPVGWTYAVTEPTGRTYNIVVPHDTELLESPGDPLDGEQVLDLISVVPIPEPNAGLAQVLTGRGVNNITVTDGHLIITFDDQTTQDAGVLPVSALREAVDYDDSVPPGSDQAITWNAPEAKFRPQTVSLPGHTHSADAVTTGVLAFARLPTGSTGTTVAPGDHKHSGADITSGVVAYSRLPVGTTSGTIAAGDDSRLSNARTPIAHAPTHHTGGSDPLAPGDIGASPTGHTHTGTDITTGTVDFARLPTGTTASTVAIGDHTHPATLIAAQTLSAATTSVIFSAIPQTYNHLKIQYSGTTTASSKQVLYLRLNGDSGISYDTQAMWATGTTTGALRRLSITAMEAGALSASSTATTSGGEVLIPGYSAAGIKMIYAQSSFFIAGDGLWVWSASGMWWNNAAAITSITLYPDNGQQFSAGATISLYGIK
jgi:hypothetical protein